MLKNDKKKIRTGDEFQKSIESTVKAISEEKNLNVYFGDTKNNNKSDIILPVINRSSELSDIKKIEKACLFPCPITGAQISKYMDGAAVGIKIKEAQRAWIKSNFKSDEAKILSDIGIKTSTHS